MTRIFPPYTYSDAPRSGCWWDETQNVPDRPPLAATIRTDVAIVGAGFTGLSAALHLAKRGVGVTVLDARSVGWGASGRNGGFCCLGGAMLGNAQLERQFGVQGRDEWVQAERAAIELVENISETHAIEIDRHSEGETELAHRPRDMEDLRQAAHVLNNRDGIATSILEKDALRDHGMAGPFHGGITIHSGFALNPRKYVNGLARAAEENGAEIFHNSPVGSLVKDHCGWRLECSEKGSVTAKKVIIATNGYSSEHLPPWLSDRYMPAQSSVIVTRPLSDAEISAQGWSTDQMAYDTRNLLHYFRLMPDRRFLFGMRGALRSSPKAEARALARVRADLNAMFPAWRDVETPFGWSGMVCIARNRVPFVGPVPDQAGLFAGLCYHGNGVAMGSYAGALLADLACEEVPSRLFPDAMRHPLGRFRLGRMRRLLLPPVYMARAVQDRWIF